MGQGFSPSVHPKGYGETPFVWHVFSAFERPNQVERLVVECEVQCIADVEGDTICQICLFRQLRCTGCLRRAEGHSSG